MSQLNGKVPFDNKSYTYIKQVKRGMQGQIYLVKNLMRNEETILKRFIIVDPESLKEVSEEAIQNVDFSDF